MTLIPVSSSWLVESGEVRQLDAKPSKKLGDLSPRRIEMRRRIAEYGSTRTPKEQARRHRRS